MLLVELMVLIYSLPFGELTNVSFSPDLRFYISFPGSISLSILRSFITRPKHLQRCPDLATYEVFLVWYCFFFLCRWSFHWTEHRYSTILSSRCIQLALT